MNNNRWWENYLIRYFLPSIAGVLLLSLIESINPTGFAIAFPLLKTAQDQTLTSASLIVWLLFGTLYCYISSYPVLVFHATRPIDFKRESLKSDVYSPWITNPILWSALFFCANWFIFATGKKNTEICGYSIDTFIFTTAAFSIFQLLRIYNAYKKTHGSGSSEHFYYYAYTLKLAIRRAAAQETGYKYQHPTKEVVESYKHLREHGNTAITLFIQLAIFPILLNAITNPSYSLVAILLCLWIIPPSLVYFTSQMFEFRFSKFTTK